MGAKPYPARLDGQLDPTMSRWLWHPQRIFDLVMGLNRWCYRVLAYAALMRDEYPPFRLDTGSHS